MLNDNKEKKKRMRNGNAPSVFCQKNSRLVMFADADDIEIVLETLLEDGEHAFHVGVDANQHQVGRGGQNPFRIVGHDDTDILAETGHLAQVPADLGSRPVDGAYYLYSSLTYQTSGELVDFADAVDDDSNG